MARRRRDWSEEFKRRVVAEASVPGASVSRIALANDVNANLVFTWRKDPRYSSSVRPSQFLPVEVKARGRRARSVAIIEARASPTTLVQTLASDVSAPGDGEIQIRLSCGAELRCRGDVDEVSLLKVLRALRRSA